MPKKRMMQIPDSGNQGGMRMWPSEDWATWLYDTANWFLIGALIVGAASTAIVVWMGNVKEEYLKRDLAAANERASKADQAAAEAKLNLELIKSPRSLKNTSQVEESLKQFPGTEYLFSGVGADEESVALLREVDGVLQQSGWKRVPARGKFPALNIFGNNSQDSVTEAIQSGVMISVEAPEDLSQKPIESLPTYVRAAIALQQGLHSNIFPPPAQSKVNLLIGGEKAVQISVGRKPI